MAELTQKERLQPSLLDRLTDDEPHSQNESRDKRVLSMYKLRESVLRDVSWLLNSDSMETVVDLTEYPEVAKSVLNYGIKDLAGRVVAGVNVTEIEKGLKQAVNNFEPRIMTNSLNVHVFKSEKMDQQALSFDIEADLWAQPLPLHLYLRTEINKITGDISLLDLDN
mgnify:FL=1